MELKPGYKQTEGGLIPEEWATERLGSLVRHHNSGVYKKRELYGRGWNIVGVSDLYDIHHVDGKVFARVPISEQERAKYTLACEDLLYGESSLVREGIARTVYVTARGAGTAFAWHTRRYSVDQNILLSAYLYYYLQARPARKHMMDQCIQTAITGINTVAYFACPVPIPPLPEQRAIAGALVDVDELIASLGKLIAKKRDLKQAAMQQLLTGQTRLPGFNGKWKVKRLGEIGSTFGGLTGKTKSDFGEGSARYITFMNIMTNVVIDPDTFEQVKVSPAESQNEVMKGDLLFNGSSETPEEVGMCAVLFDDVQNVFLNSFCFGFRFREDAETNGLYLAYFFRSSEGRELLKSLAQGATRYNLSKTSLLKLNFPLPPLSEQTAIAAVLSDMDAELAALEARRDKTRGLKQGMMQELLTGRTRIV